MVRNACVHGTCVYNAQLLPVLEQYCQTTYYYYYYYYWRSGSVVRRMNEVALRWAWLVLVFGRYRM